MCVLPPTFTGVTYYNTVDLVVFVTPGDVFLLCRQPPVLRYVYFFHYVVVSQYIIAFDLLRILCVSPTFLPVAVKA